METDRLLPRRESDSRYNISKWLYMQLIPLGIIGWTAKEPQGVSLDDVSNDSPDIEVDIQSARPKNRKPLLDDSYRLNQHPFGLSKCRRKYYFILSTILLFLASLATTFLFFRNMFLYFGQRRHIVHFISMTSYSINLIMLPVGCTLSRIYFHFIGKEYISTLDCCSIAWCLWMFLEESFVVRRIRFLPVISNKRPSASSAFLVVAFISCLVTAYTSFFVYYMTPEEMECDARAGYLLLTGNIGAIFFALFCNYVYLLRTSLREELIFLVKYCYCNEGDTESCRRRIVSMVRDYRVIRSVTNLWMQVVLPSSVLGLVVHLKWNYLVFTSDSKIDEAGYRVTDLVLMSVHICICKGMVTILPLLALGGTDLQYMWNEMRLTLSLIQQSHAEKFWREILKFIQKLNPHGTEEWVASIALSVIGIYLGLKVGTQDVDYFCS